MEVLTKIKDKVGYDSFEKGKQYPKNYIRYIGFVENNRGKQHLFEVESERTYDYYNVRIIEKEDEIVSTYCNCSQFNRAGNCKHIAASLLNCKEKIFPAYQRNFAFQITNQILDAFYKKQEGPKIKKQLTLEIELEFRESTYYYYKTEPMVYYKLKIGEDKLYSLNNKMSNFIECYRGVQKSMSFGKGFTYNSDIHYFNEEDQNIIDRFIMIYENTHYHSNGIGESIKKSRQMLELVRNKNIFIYGKGVFNGIKEGNPIETYLEKKENEYILKIKNKEELYRLTSNYEFTIKDGVLYHLSEESLDLLSKMGNAGIEELIFREENLEKFVGGVLPIIKNNIEIEDKLQDTIIIGKEPTPKIYIDYINFILEAEIKFDYDGKEINFFDKSTNLVRDTFFEQNVIMDLLKLNFREEKKKFIIDEINSIVDFINENLEVLGQKYEVFTTNRLRETKIIKETNIQSNFSIGKDNILKYSFDLGDINKNEIGDILDSLRKKNKYYKLKSGNIIKLEDNENLNEFEELLDSIELNEKDIKNGKGEIPKYRAIYIDSLRDKKNSIIGTNNLFNELVSNFKEYKNSNVDLTKKDLTLLRDYQVNGIKWLYNIYKCGFGGILADEMGLGKSIQLIYLIRQIIKEKPNAKILIISPTSLVYNWKNEFDKFGSELNYKVLAENKAKRKEELEHLENINIIITTYGLIREDNEEYEKIDFELITIDEAQNIKNPNAKMTKEIKSLRANTKLALTGTPVENSVMELWSIFDFIMPGYLANMVNFQRKYNVKEVDENNLKKLQILNRQISPFIMRRKKKDVIKELPPKIENNIYLDLYKEQKELYVAQLEKTREEIENTIKEEGFQKARFKILQLLTKLRQICIDPRIIYENYKGGSSKIDNAVKTIREIIDNGHKILLFTSYRTALDIMNRELTNEGISTYVIDGSVSSRKRMELVEKFNQDDTNVFLIMLKAGGTGLNLTSADVVIHLDLWWNPQVENQATDRAHRIGQTHTVEVIKMICKGTIEERILELQEKKKILSDNLIEGEDIDQNIISKLTEKDIKRLLSIDNDD